MKNEQKERLVQLIIDSVNGCARNWAEVIADHLLANGVVAIDTEVVSMKNRPLISTVASLPIDEAIDLARAKEECRLIVPPCKVGDSVYWFNMNGEIEEAQVIEPSFVARLKDGFEYDVRYSDVGKTVFLTRELAEEKLDE